MKYIKIQNNTKMFKSVHVGSECYMFAAGQTKEIPREALANHNVKKLLECKPPILIRR